MGRSLLNLMVALFVVQTTAMGCPESECCGGTGGGGSCCKGYCNEYLCGVKPYSVKPQCKDGSDNCGYCHNEEFLKAMVCATHQMPSPLQTYPEASPENSLWLTET